MNEAISYKYYIEFGSGHSLKYSIIIDGHKLLSKPIDKSEPPEWTRLENEQCSHCPLNSQEHTHCPIAKKIFPIITDWNNITSCEDTKVTVQADKRVTSCVTTAHKALSSLLGLLMASSECPHTQFLKPLCRSHLPMASSSETTYRVISYFLIAHYFSDCQVSEDEQIQKLAKLYENLQTMNSALCNRIRNHLNNDASVNAITLLHALSFILPTSFKQTLLEMRHMVAPISELLEKSEGLEKGKYPLISYS